MFGVDYAAYITSVETESQASDNPFIPEYLLPSFRPLHPWESGGKHGLEEDFILVAEFCEIEGPKPLMCIPKDGGSCFNQNDFVVKIMAVDHQTSTDGFSVSKDTQVVISDTEDGVCSFVHHLILFDIQARGFVRSFCIAYITSDKRKIMTFYEELSSQFKKVATFMKYGNRIVFIQELERRLMDLQYSTGQLKVKTNMSDCDGCPGDESSVKLSEEDAYLELEKIRQSMTEIQQILSTLKPLMNDTRMEYYIQRQEEKAAFHSSCQHKMPNQDTASLPEQTADNQNGEPIKCGSLAGSEDSSFQQTGHYTPKLVELTRCMKFDSALRNIHELCSWGAKEGIKKLHQIHEYYKQETLIIEIEQEEMALLEPAGSLITCGQCITSNFLSGVNLGNPAPSSPHSGPIGAISMNSSRLSLPLSDQMSLDSFKSLSTFESFEDDDDMYSIEQTSCSSLVLDTCSAKVATVDPVTPQTPDVTHFTSQVSCESDSTSSLYQTDEAASLSDPVKTNRNNNSQENSNKQIGIDSHASDNQGNTDKQGDHHTMDKSSNVSQMPELVSQNAQNKTSVDVKNGKHSTSNNAGTSLLSSALKADKLENSSTNSDTLASELTEQAAASRVLTLELNTEASKSNSELAESNLQYSQEPERKVSKDSSVSSSYGITICQHSSLDTANLSPCSCCSVSPPDLTTPASCAELRRVNNFSSNMFKLVADQIEKNPENQENVLHSSEESATNTSSSSSALPIARKNKMGCFSLGDSINNLQPGMPGFGILSVLNIYTHLDPILYSLLTGRTVLVVGSSVLENDVITVVKALSVFLPDHRRKHSSVVEWLSKPLRITDLGRIKLAGVCRPEKKILDTVIPSVIKKYVSVLDIERKTVMGPVYQGSLLNVFSHKRKAFSTDTEFVAFIHCWLMEISSKAFIFYHSFCLGSGSIISDYRLYNQGENYRNTVKIFMAKLSILNSDVHIIEYLCEMVKLSQIELAGKLINTDSGIAVRPISLSYESCYIFRA